MHWLLALFLRGDPESSNIPPDIKPFKVQYRLGCDAIDWILEGGQPPYYVTVEKQGLTPDSTETPLMFITSSSTYHYIMPPNLGMHYWVLLSVLNTDNEF
jgi:hypothetical protein